MITQYQYEKAVELFKTDEDLFADEFFQSKIREAILKVSGRPQPPKGMHYKRGAWDYFSENGLFNASNLINAYKAVRDKVRKMPMNVREQIKGLINEAVRETILHYAETFPTEPINTETK